MRRSTSVAKNSIFDCCYANSTFSCACSISRICLICCCSLHALFWLAFLYGIGAGGFFTYSLALSFVPRMLSMAAVSYTIFYCIRYLFSSIAYFFLLRTSIGRSSHWFTFCMLSCSTTPPLLFCVLVVCTSNFIDPY